MKGEGALRVAQGRRHLSQYRNAEIKGLLADLLGLEEIGRLGMRAQEVARGLKAGLTALRVRQSELSIEEDRVREELGRLHGAEQGVAAAMQECQTARTACDVAQLAQARLQADQSQSVAADEQRAAGGPAATCCGDAATLRARVAGEKHAKASTSRCMTASRAIPRASH